DLVRSHRLVRSRARAPDLPRSLERLESSWPATGHGSFARGARPTVPVAATINREGSTPMPLSGSTEPRTQRLAMLVLAALATGLHGCGVGTIGGGRDVQTAGPFSDGAAQPGSDAGTEVSMNVPVDTDASMAESDGSAGGTDVDGGASVATAGLCDPC